jgi:hypothetical protein
MLSAVQRPASLGNALIQAQSAAQLIERRNGGDGLGDRDRIGPSPTTESPTSHVRLVILHVK